MACSSLFSVQRVSSLIHERRDDYRIHLQPFRMVPGGGVYFWKPNFSIVIGKFGPINNFRIRPTTCLGLV
jgi:hypothetical protein